MKLKMCLLLLSGVCGTVSAQQKNYSIKGHLTGISGDRKVILTFKDGNRKVADSTVMHDGIFSFTGSFEEPVEAAVSVYPAAGEGKVNKLGIIPAAERVRIMVVADPVTLEGEHLKTAKIEGGKTEDEFLAYNKAMVAMLDSIKSIWKSQQGTLPEDSAASVARLTYAYGRKTREFMVNYVVNHPASYVAFNVFKQATVVVSSPQDAQRMREALAPAFGESTQFKTAVAKIEKVLQLAVGQPAIAFSQTDNHGKMVSLADVKGKYVLVDFWASWCGPCRMEYPYLKKAYATYKDKNFEIIGVSLDDKKDLWLNAIEQNGFEWIQLCDLKGGENAVAKAYGISAIPQNFLLSPDGKIIAKNLRGSSLAEKLAEVIQ